MAHLHTTGVEGSARFSCLRSRHPHLTGPDGAADVVGAEDVDGAEEGAEVGQLLIIVALDGMQKFNSSVAGSHVLPEGNLVGSLYLHRFWQHVPSRQLLQMSPTLP